MPQIFEMLGAGQPAFSTEVQVGAWVRQFAFGYLEPTATVFHAAFGRFDNAYARPNQAALANYNINGVIHYFCEDLDFQDRRGNYAEWTREVCSLPANYNTAETYSYTFPGYYLGRDPYTDEPTVRLQRDFFLIGNVTHGASYATATAIPRFAPQNYAWAYHVDGSGFVEKFDGLLANTNANLGLFQSTPNLSTYQGWVAGATEIEVAASRLLHIRGPVWLRERRFAVAQ